jgi:hypothetical protein
MEQVNVAVRRHTFICENPVEISVDSLAFLIEVLRKLYQTLQRNTERVR